LDIIKARPTASMVAPSNSTTSFNLYPPTFPTSFFPTYHPPIPPNTMAGNKYDRERAPPPPSNPPSPPAPLRGGHYEEILAAINRLENAPHPLATIASIDFRLRDPATVTQNAVQTMGVSVIPHSAPGRLFDTPPGTSSTDDWARWANDIPPLLRDGRLEAIIRGFERVSDEAVRAGRSSAEVRDGNGSGAGGGGQNSDNNDSAGKKSKNNKGKKTGGKKSNDGESEQQKQLDDQLVPGSAYEEEEDDFEYSDLSDTSSSTGEPAQKTKPTAPVQTAAQTHTVDDEDVVSSTGSDSSDSDSDPHQQQTTRSHVSNVSKKQPAQASRSSATEPGTQSTRCDGSMPPPALPPVPSTGPNDRGTNEEARSATAAAAPRPTTTDPDGRADRANSHVPTASPRQTTAGSTSRRGTISHSYTGPTLRDRSLSRISPPEAAKATEAKRKSEAEPWRNSTGKKVRGWVQADDDESPENSINPEGFPGDSRKRKSPSKSATPASAADAEPQSERPAKKTRRQDSQSSSDENFEHGSGTEEEGDPHESTRIADPEEDLDLLENEPTAADDGSDSSDGVEVVWSRDDPIDRSRRREVRGFIMSDLWARGGNSVTYRVLLAKLMRRAGGGEVYENEFRTLVDCLVHERKVRSRGSGMAQELWISADGTESEGSAAAGERGDQKDEENEEDEEDEENEDEEEDEEDENVIPANDKPSSSDDDASDNDPEGNNPTGNDPNDNDPDDDDNPSDGSSDSVWGRRHTDLHRRAQLKVLIPNEINAWPGNNAKYVDVLVKLREMMCGRLRLDKTRGAAVVQGTEFERAVNTLVHEDKVRSSGHERSRRLWLEDEDDVAQAWEDLPGWRPRDFLPPSGNDNNSDARQTSRRPTLLAEQLRNDLGEAILRYLRRHRGEDTTYEDLLVAMEEAHDGSRSIPAEEFRRTVQRLVRDDRVQEEGVGVKRILRIPTVTTPTGGSDSGVEDEEADDQDGNVAKKSGGKRSPEDGLEAQSPGQAHKFKHPSRVEKSSNSHQPNRMIVDRRQAAQTSWTGSVGGGEEEVSKSGPASGNEVQEDAEVEEPPPVRERSGKAPPRAIVKRGSNQQQQQPEASPAKVTRKRKATRTEDPAVVEEGVFLSPIPSKARDANFDSDNEYGGQPPLKKTKSAQKTYKSKK
jgi:hypothetical protein